MSKASPNLGKTGFASPYGKHVFVYDTKGNFVQEYGSIRDCGFQLSIPDCKIREIIRGKGPTFSYNGFIFFDEDQGFDIIPPITGIARKKRPVLVYDNQMRLLASYAGLKEAAVSQNICVPTITNACKTLCITRKNQFWRYTT